MPPSPSGGWLGDLVALDIHGAWVWSIYSGRDIFVPYLDANSLIFYKTLSCTSIILQLRDKSRAS